MSVSSIAFRFLNEPLIQFLLLGAVLFLTSHTILDNRIDPRRIVIDDQQLSELITIFKEGQGREPSPSEINNLIIKWTQNEILYREARDLEMDQGDEMIRNRLVLKMRNVLFNRVIVAKPQEEELRSFFEFKRDDYDLPARFDLEQFQPDTDMSYASAQELARELGDKTAPEEYKSRTRQYYQRPQPTLGSLFGNTSDRLINAKLNQWTVVKSNQGLHIARVLKHYPAEPVTLDSVRSRVTQDWKKFRNDIQLADQTKSIADQYRIKLELSPALQARLQPVTSTDDLKPAPDTAPEQENSGTAPATAQLH